MRLTFQTDKIKVISTRKIPPVEGSAGVNAATVTGVLPDRLSLPVGVFHGSTGHPKPRAIHQVPKRDALIFEPLRRMTQAFFGVQLASICN